MRSHVLVVGALVAFFVILVPAVSTSFASAPLTNATVENESVTVSESNRTAVAQASNQSVASFNGSVTVYYSNGSTANTSTYNWYDSTGEIQANGSSLDAEAVTVTYGYQFKSAATTTAEELLSVLLPILAVFLIILGAGVVGAFLSYGYGGRR
jgi:hypothetical protein